MGIHQLFRRLPNLLCLNVRARSIRHILDWFDPSLPNLLHRDLHRSHDRRGLLPTSSDRGNRIHDFRHLHDLRRDTVLAAHPIARDMHGPWIRVHILPGDQHGIDVLQQEAVPRNRHHSLRLRLRRPHLPRHGAATTPLRRLRLGRPRNRLRTARHPLLRHPLHEIAAPAPSRRFPRRVARV